MPMIIESEWPWALVVLAIVAACWVFIAIWGATRERLKVIFTTRRLYEIEALNHRIDGLWASLEEGNTRCQSQVDALDKVVSGLRTSVQVLRCKGHKLKVTAVDKNKYRTFTMPSGVREELPYCQKRQPDWAVTLKCDCGYTETKTYSDLTVKLRNAVDSVQWPKTETLRTLMRGK